MNKKGEGITPNPIKTPLHPPSTLSTCVIIRHQKSAGYQRPQCQDKCIMSYKLQEILLITRQKISA